MEPHGARSGEDGKRHLGRHVDTGVDSLEAPRHNRSSQQVSIVREKGTKLSPVGLHRKRERQETLKI